jgi:hypothetical protein
VDPSRDHLRARRAEDRAVPFQRLLCEIRELGYTGSMNRLCCHITQGCAGAGQPHLSPSRVTRSLLTRPDALDALAVIAALILPFCKGRTECVNTKTKMIKRQTYGRAGFNLLRHRILLS